MSTFLRAQNMMSVALLGLFLISCGGASKASPDDIREQLRRNSDRAFSGTRAKRKSRKRSQPPAGSHYDSGSSHSDPDALPAGVNCDDAVRCFPRELYMSALGLGMSTREAELDARDRVAAQISSTINSAITLKTVEGDQIESQTQGQIIRRVTVHFKRAELIEHRPARAADDDSYQVIAYLSLERYRTEVDPDLGRALRELESLVQDAEQTSRSDHFV